MFDPSTIKQKIASVLSSACPGHDVSVRIERNPYGFWIWDESEQVHKHMTPGYLMWALGEKQPLQEYTLQWKDVQN